MRCGNKASISAIAKDRSRTVINPRTIVGPAVPKVYTRNMLGLIRNAIAGGRRAALHHHHQHSRHLGTAPVAGVDYVQGQAPEPRIREYFYYIDHEGYVSCKI